MSDRTQVTSPKPDISVNRPSESNSIRIRGARQHNLKNIDLEIPRDRLIVFTGVSGSGKSSLAFDTIFAEGQRRYVESLSAYARQFLGQLDKPDVDAIEGLSPAISIDQKSTSHNPRSTVGTVTEIYDYFRLLFGRAGVPHCPICDRCIAPQTIDEMCDRVMAFPDGTRFQVLAPVVRGKKGTHQKLISGLAAEGFVRVRVNGEVRELSDSIELDKNGKHTIEVVIDRLIMKPDLRERLADSLGTCLKRAEGIATIQILKWGERATESNFNININSNFLSNYYQPQANQAPIDNNKNSHPDESDSQQLPQEFVFSENFACPEHGAVMQELSPRLFSFNSPYGACPTCHGLGSWRTFSEELLVPDPDAPVYSAIAPWSGDSKTKNRRTKSNGDNLLSQIDKHPNAYYLRLLYEVGQEYKFELDTPWNELTSEQQQVILHGSDRPVWVEAWQDHRRFIGVIPILQKQVADGTELQKQKLESFLVDETCHDCQGNRLKDEAISVRLGQYRITDFTGVSISECCQRVQKLELSDRQTQIGDLVLKEIKARLQFLLDVGLDYLTLDRAAMTLSGGEAQRIRLATQIGAGLTGVLYVLDEPSIGLHQRDNTKLLKTLLKLKDLGNTLIVVEHDEETIRAADYLVDIGPGAGVHGGHIVAQGELNRILVNEESLTGAYLSGRKRIETPPERREGNGRSLILKNAHRHNLKHLDVEIPLGKLVAVTGVSGSGKSTLINELLYHALQHYLTKNVPFPSGLKEIQGLEEVDKVIVIDQSPIGRTPRSNPATYTGLFDVIREVFSLTVEAKVRGYKPGQFSFNVKGGRCEACCGQGVNVIEMNFLPDVYVQCDVCKGARYNKETLQVKYKNKSIADVLDMTVEEGLDFFQNIPRAVTRLQTLMDVGLGYLRLGQTAPTLSGGEAQRVKLASELSRRATGKTLYLIDEPTTGLSFYDVHKLLDVLQKLVDKGNSVLAIEHNLDVIRCADWIIDLGPEGGDKGGEVIAMGTPEVVAKNKKSYTGQYLKQIL
jgi:excinuclease ABC subunit A